jgi:hypothetical protein
LAIWHSYVLLGNYWIQFSAQTPAVLTDVFVLLVPTFHDTSGERHKVVQDGFLSHPSHFTIENQVILFSFLIFQGLLHVLAITYLISL